MKRSFFAILSFLWALLTLYLTTRPNLVVAPDNALNTILMNGAHFTFFGIEAVLLYFSLKSLQADKLISLLSILATSVFGYYIEILQRSIPGRTYDLFDWALDTLGAIIFVFVIKKLTEKLKS